MTNSVKDWMKAHKVKTFWLGLLLLFCCVELYDGTPHRFWLTRQLRTLFFVEVTVQLEIAGEPLTLTRDIRCIKQWEVRTFRDASWVLDAQVYDAVGGMTKTGRTFVVNFDDICDPFLNDLRPIQQAPAEVKTVYEPIGTGKQPDEIKVYMFELAKTNQIADVKLISATMTKKQRFKLFDREQYDNWSSGWYRKPVQSNIEYRGYIFSAIDLSILTLDNRVLKWYHDCVDQCIFTLKTYTDNIRLSDEVQNAIYKLSLQGDHYQAVRIGDHYTSDFKIQNLKILYPTPTLPTECISLNFIKDDMTLQQCLPLREEYNTVKYQFGDLTQRLPISGDVILYKDQSGRIFRLNPDLK